jgi:hypothetical protein
MWSGQGAECTDDAVCRRELERVWWMRPLRHTSVVLGGRADDDGAAAPDAAAAPLGAKEAPEGICATAEGWFSLVTGPVG